MDHINWNEVSDQPERPEKGGYITKITAVEDNTEKKCLFINWDFIDGPFKGANQDAASRLGFWPMKIARSYKPTALSFFKAFKTAVEDSNRGYQFNNDPQSLVGKYIGVVLGEEAYLSKKQEIKTRTYVYQTRSVQAIQSGDYSIPDFKPLSETASAPNPFSNVPTGFAPVDDDDSECPF